jgi:hypothetical protein
LYPKKKGCGWNEEGSAHFEEAGFSHPGSLPAGNTGHLQKLHKQKGENIRIAVSSKMILENIKIAFTKTKFTLQTLPVSPPTTGIFL